MGKNKDTDYRDRLENIQLWKNEAGLGRDTPSKKMGINKDTDYHDRLEREITSLRKDLILADTEVTQLKFDLRRANQKCMAQTLENNRLQDKIDHVTTINRDLMETNTQLRQAIAVLNDEPVNSL